MKYEAEILVHEKAELGEGPLWDAHGNMLYYVDITRGRVHRYNPASGENRFVELGEPVGCIVPYTGGGIVAAARSGLIHIDTAFNVAGRLINFNLPGRLRTNDGKCDRLGRLWLGTMAVDQSAPDSHGVGALLRVGACVEEIAGGMTIPNGLAWNTGDTAFYHIDTSKRRVDRYDFDLESGAVSGKRTIISVPESEGAPDGMVADEEGMLWIAMWGGRQVCRYNPITGGKLASVPIPANRVSCCAFGGADMSELFVTTAMDEDGGGEVYIVKTGVRGAAVFEYT